MHWCLSGLLIFLCLLPQTISTQDRSAHIAARDLQFDTVALQKYANDPAYRYDSKPPESSFLMKLWRQFVDRLKEAFGSAGNQRILVLILLAGVLGILIYHFAKTHVASVLMKKDLRLEDPYVLDTRPDEDRIAVLITAAVEQEDFRSAFRWTYIDLLKKLAAHGIVQLHRTKTNRDYRAEVAGHPIGSGFAQLADAFDYVWYGEYQIDRQAFEKQRTQALQILNQITTQ